MRKKLLFFLLLLIALSSREILIAQTISSDSLILHLPFNGGPNDISGNNYHGFVNNAVLTSDNRNQPNGAYYFNGINSSITIPDIVKLDRELSEFTVLIQLQPEHLLPDYSNSFPGHANYNFITWHRNIADSVNAFKRARLNASWSNYRNFYPPDSLTARMHYFLGGCEVPFGYAGATTGYMQDSLSVIGKWHTIAFVCKNNVVKSYFNCELQRSWDIYQSINKNCGSGPVQISLANVPSHPTLLRGYKYFKGKIGDIRVYSRALTDNEIKIYADNLCVTTPSGVKPAISIKADPCEPNKIYLEDLSESNGMTALRRVWKIGSLDSVDSKTFHHVFTNVGIQPIQLKVFTDSIHQYTLDTFVNILQIGPPKFLRLASSQLTACKGSSVTPKISGAVSYAWTPCQYLSDCSSPTPTVSSETNIVYKIVGINDKGCYDTVHQKIVIVGAAFNVFVPSAFTPNGDGKNDYFGFSCNQNLESLEFSVYNRWGQKVYHTTSQNGLWDGVTGEAKRIPGVYVWQLKYKSGSGCSEQIKSGSVLLMQ